MIQTQSQISSSITNSNLSNGSSITTNQIQYPQVSNQNQYSIRGLNCIFTGSISCSSSKSCNPYIVMKINGQNIISSVCKVVSNSAFWNDCLSLRVDQDQRDKLITLEIHNYTLYQTERDLFDPNYDEKDYLGGAIIDLTDVISERILSKGYNNNNSSGNFTVLSNQTSSSSLIEGKYSQIPNITGSLLSNGSSSSSNSNQNNIVYLGQAKIINQEGVVIGSLQFNMHKDSNQINNMYSNATSTQSTQQVLSEDSQKSINYKQNEILPQMNKNMQMLQQSISFQNQVKSSSEYQIKRESLYEEKEYSSNKNVIQTPSTCKHIVFNNNLASQCLNYNLKSNPYHIYTIKSTVTESEDQKYHKNYQQTQQNAENSQTPRQYSYNTIQLGEEDRVNEMYINTNIIDESNSSNFQDCEQYDQGSYYSQENEVQQPQQVYPSQIGQHQKNTELLQAQNLPLSEYQNNNIVISPLRDIHDKNGISSLSLSQNGKKYIGSQCQFGQPISQYPQIYSQQQLQHLHQNQQAGLINLQNISYQPFNGNTPTISQTCSQRNNQLNQIQYQNFTQGIQVLGQNSMNSLPNQQSQFQFQNNFIRTVQSQKAIVNKIQQINPSLNQHPSPSIVQYPNNGVNQIASSINNTVATPGAIQKSNLAVTTSRQPFSAAATQFS